MTRDRVCRNKLQIKTLKTDFTVLCNFTTIVHNKRNFLHMLVRNTELHYLLYAIIDENIYFLDVYGAVQFNIRLQKLITVG